MIKANIKDCEKHYNLGPIYRDVFDKLRLLDKDSATGSLEYIGFKLGVSNADTFDHKKDGSPRDFEAHRKFVDIHYVISGSEGISFADVNTLTPITDYDDDNDFILLSGRGERITLGAGDFCILFPNDAHISQMHGTEGDKVKKAVVKIAL